MTQRIRPALSLSGVVLGILLSLSPIAYFGYHHSTTEPYVQGVLLGYMLPIGYVGLTVGLSMALHPWIFRLQRHRLERLLEASGVSLVSTLAIQSSLLGPEFFINLRHGTRFAKWEIDVDQYGLGFWPLLIVAILTCVAGLWQLRAATHSIAPDNGTRKRWEYEGASRFANPTGPAMA